MNKGLLFTIAGIVLFILSLTADWIGIGLKPGIGFGQIAGMVIGIIIAVYGLKILSKKS